MPGVGVDTARRAPAETAAPPVTRRLNAAGEAAKALAEAGRSSGTNKPIAAGVSSATAATAAPQAADTPGPLLPTFGGSFNGIAESESGQIPPDVAMAAGPFQVVVATNGRVKALNKNGTLVAGSSQSLGAFFGGVTTDGTFDPHVVWDQYIGRFWVVAVSEHDSTAADPANRSRILVGLSNSNDVTGGWTTFATDATLNGNAASNNWCDFPNIGVDAQAVYFTCNMFAFPAGGMSPGGFQFVKLRVMTKAQFTGNTCCAWWDFWNLREDTFGITASFTVQPAHMYGANAGAGEFLIDAHTFCIFCPPNTLEVWQLTNAQRCCGPGPRSAPDLNQHSHDVGNFPTAPNARQSGTTTRIDTGDTRLLFAFWQGGRLSTGQNLSCNSGNDACIAFTQLNVAGGLGSISTIKDFAYQTANVDYYYPGVDVNNAGNMSMVFTRSSSSEFAGASWIGIPAGSCANCVDGPEASLQAGAASYVDFGFPPGSRNRWGDYLTAAADPDGTGIWIDGEFAASTNRWGTRVGLTYELQDTTPPTTTALLSPLPNGAGWNNTDVTVTLTATDNTGVRRITFGATGAQPMATTTVNGSSATLLINTEGITAVNFFATDNWGNQEAPKSVTVRLDKTAPALSAARSPGPNAQGWNNTDVTVTFTCFDALSGVNSFTGPATLSGEGAGQSVSGQCTDNAGNATSLTVTGINIDKTPPSISGSRTPPPNANGWNNTDVTVNFACADALSGVASCSAPTVLSGEGAGQSVTGTAVDNADNTASATVGGINIDKTPPTVTYTGNAGVYTVDQMVDIICTAADNLSGVASTTCANIVGQAFTFGLGAHTFSASATDFAGNTGTGSTTFTVSVTAASLEALTQQFVTKAGVAHALSVKLEHCQINAYINQVRAQAGKSLTQDEADLLIQLALALVCSP